MGKILITEDEKKRILNLYGILKEANPAPAKSTETLKLDKTINFGPGYYNPKFTYTSPNGTTYNWDVDTTLKDGLNNIKEFLKKNPTGYVVSVKLESGESQIPNTDNQEGGKRVDPNYLNDARLNTLKKYITPIFDSWKSEGINTNFTITEDKKIGTTPWIGSVFCPANSTKEQARSVCTTNYMRILGDAKDPLHSQVNELKKKYNSEQYFRVVIEVNKSTVKKTVDSKCATGLKIRVWVESHNCQNAEFFMFANSTLLYNSVGGMTANLNNSYSSRGIPKADSSPIFGPKWLNPGYGYLKNGDGTYSYGYGKLKPAGDVGGSRSDSFEITSEQSASIVANGNGYIDIWMIASTTAAHKDIPNVTITKPGVNEPIFDGKPNIIQGKLLRLDACGDTKLELGTDSTVPNAMSYVGVLKQEKISTMRSAGEKPEEEEIDPNTGKRKKLKLDQKAVLLDRLDILNQDMFNLILYLGTQLTPLFNPKAEASKKLQSPLPDDVYQNILTRLQTDYPKIVNEINNKGTTEEPVLSLRRNEDGEYENKTINKDDLYGDVRDYLNKFYRMFDKVYFNRTSKQYSPEGSIDNLKTNWGKLYTKLETTPDWPFKGIAGTKLA
jgi:hypothetical protein